MTDAIILMLKIGPATAHEIAEALRITNIEAWQLLTHNAVRTRDRRGRGLHVVWRLA